MKTLLFIFRFIWPYLHRYRKRFILAFVFGALFGLSQASFVWATKTIFERMEPPPSESAEITEETPNLAVPLPELNLAEQLGELNEKVTRVVDQWLPRMGRPINWKQILGCTLFLPLFVIVRSIFGYCSNYYMKWTGEKLLNEMRQSMLEKINTLSMDFFTKSKTGDLQQRINKDTDSVAFCVKLGMGDLAKQPVSAISLIAFLLYIDWGLTLMAFIAIPACLIPVAVLGRKSYQATKGTVFNNVTSNSLFVETIANMRMVKAFGLQVYLESRFANLRRIFFGHSMRRHRAELLVNPLIEFGAAIAASIILIGVFVMEKDIPDLVGFLTGMGLLFTPIKKLANIHVTFQNAKVGIERLQETTAFRSSIQERHNPVRLEHFKNQIEFRNVSFRYETDWALRHINVTLRQGARLGVAGESGSGKSSLVNLLFRFYDPQEGELRIDGHPYTDVSLSDLRNLMAMVSQDILLFNTTVEDNIRFGRLDASETDIIQAARDAFAHDFISELPDGYKTIIGERGTTLSGGQRQRLSIARAFVRDAPILILDEATSALDSTTEKEIQAALEKLSYQRTVFSIAHRLSTLKSCDEILVLDRGVIMEQGTSTALRDKGGLYASMLRQQEMHTN